MSGLFRKYFGITFFIFCINQMVVMGNFEFGCNFKNENYDVDLGKNTSNPIFGNEVTPLIIKDKEALKELIDKLKDIIAREFEINLYNDVDRLFNFYDDFKAQAEPFRQFFDNWKPKLNPHEGTVEIPISLMEKLKKELPQLKEHMYPAANIKSREYRLKLSQFKAKSPGDLDVTPDDEPVIDHVSVIIRISLDQRRGYIVMDPALGMNTPIVLMENPTFSELSQRSESPQSVIFVYDTMPKNPHNAKVLVYDNDTVLATFLTYFPKPFCSFMAHTVKPSLFFTDRSIIRRNTNGDPTRGLYFNMRQFSYKPAFIIGRENVISTNKPKYVKTEYLYKETVEYDESNRYYMPDDDYLWNQTDELLHFEKGQSMKIVKKVRAIMSDATFSKPYIKINTDIKKFFENPETIPVKKEKLSNRVKKYFCS